ncbi:MAG: hypothetical protein JW779_05375, partial [Candidatus Thorarchaeota archaeon]|nr:hypothetical protein [Candidatus Thorarchaeota archaeon]
MEEGFVELTRPGYFIMDWVRGKEKPEPDAIGDFLRLIQWAGYLWPIYRKAYLCRNCQLVLIRY